MHEVLDLVLRKHAGPVIVPMTLIDPRYFGETVGRLREGGHDVWHFSLLADRATVPPGEAWADNPRAVWSPA